MQNAESLEQEPNLRGEIEVAENVMAEPGKINSRRPGGTGLSLATALGLIAVAFLWDRIAPLDRVALPAKDKAFPETGEADRHASPAELATEGGNRGRQASSPAEIPARGWKDILWRVYGNIGDHRVLALAAGMTYYSLLAIFPAIAALVAIYGLFSDPGSIAKHLDDVSGFIPGGAVEVAREQLTRVATKGDRTLGFTFAIGLAISLWSANAAMKSLFDTLNIVYGEQEKRGFVKLNAMSLGFTVGGDRLRRGGAWRRRRHPRGAAIRRIVQCGGPACPDRTLACTLHGSGLRPRLHLPVRPQPPGAAVDVDHLGQRGCGPALARRIRSVFFLRRELRHLQCHLWVLGRGHRLHDVALDLGDRDPARSRAQRGDGASDGA